MWVLIAILIVIAVVAVAAVLAGDRYDDSEYYDDER
jgi:hypothetical protein